MYSTSAYAGASSVYDYIVIGAGSAGAVVAKELSDDKHRRVLLIEAGPYRDNDVNVLDPAKVSNVVDGAKYNFDYYTNHVQSLGGRRVDATEGRMWGGTSSHNGMYYVRGNDYDYKRWALYGGDKWSPARVNSIFKQMENNSLLNVENEQEFLQYHGVSGRLDTFNTVPDRDKYNIFYGALHDVFNISFNPDYNGATQEGIAKSVQFTWQVNNGEILRESSSTSYLSEDIVHVNDEGDGIGVSGRRLTVHSLSYATKLILKGKVVKGVQYIRSGIQQQAFARFDVIVSSGTFHSPALLMKSGIGNCSELASLGIKCVLDNPQIGRNMGNHIAIAVYVTKTTADPLAYLSGAGPLCFYKSKLADQYTDRSISGGKVEVDSQLYYLPGAPFGSAKDQLTARKLETIDPLTGEVRPQVTFSLISTLLRPKCGTGRVYLASRDPLAPPVIEVDFLCDPLDVQWFNTTLNDLMAVVQRMSQQDPTISLSYPTPDLLTPQYRDYTLRTLSADMSHWVGTSSMGKVVDGNLCVKGVGGLRIADASVIPFVPTGNTNAPAMMVGKNAADIIKSTRSCSL